MRSVPGQDEVHSIALVNQFCVQINRDGEARISVSGSVGDTPVLCRGGLRIANKIQWVHQIYTRLLITFLTVALRLLVTFFRLKSVKFVGRKVTAHTGPEKNKRLAVISVG